MYKLLKSEYCKVQFLVVILHPKKQNEHETIRTEDRRNRRNCTR